MSGSGAGTAVVRCTCGAKIKVPISAAGRKAKCPNCDKLFRIPSIDKSKRPAATIRKTPPPSPDEMFYAFAENEQSAPSLPKAAPETASPPSESAKNPANGPTCRSCGKVMPADAKICINCGINLKTGRSLITTQEDTLDRAYIVAENTIRVISWLFWIGLYPIASEAFGTARPYVIRGVAIITIVASVAYWLAGFDVSSGRDRLMLWCGTTDIDTLVDADELTPEELEETAAWLLEYQRESGGQQAHQFITHAFLHNDVIHLAGNLLFLMVLGTRVNALVGNIWTIALYPALAITAGVAHSISAQDDLLQPMLGASGAVMGMAGMYLVFFPVHKVHMAAWARLGLFFGFRLSLKLFTVRGFWVVLFYIAFDVLYTVIGLEDNVAHWAHLGGFIAGVAIAMTMLLARLVNARGGDIISVVLGRHAWSILGRPRSEADS